MSTSVRFKKSQIAPCGMNCGTCIAFLREKNSCPGCRVLSADKSVSGQRCIIPKCSYLKETGSKFCYECDKYPCRRMKQLEKRYSTKYNTSFYENLSIIKEKGIDEFLAFESKRRSCTSCGATLSVHRTACLECETKIN